MEILVNPVSLAKEPRFISLKPKKTQFQNSSIICPPTTSSSNSSSNGVSSFKFPNSGKKSFKKNQSGNCQERPFKIFVKTQTFTVDSSKLANLSPIFAAMCFGQEFENGRRELSREIVDENSDDIADFLNCLQLPKKITQWNFATILRLANKYQVKSLKEDCENFILTTNLSQIKPDQVLTLLLASLDYHLKRQVICQLILRLAEEDVVAFTRLKLNRFLSTKLYSNLIATSVNVRLIKEYEIMNGHVFRMDKQKIQYRHAYCELCKKIESETSRCDECLKTFCKHHYKTNKCINNYGQRMLDELKQNCVELDEDYCSDGD